MVARCRLLFCSFRQRCFTLRREKSGEGVKARREEVRREPKGEGENPLHAPNKAPAAEKGRGEEGSPQGEEGSLVRGKGSPWGEKGSPEGGGESPGGRKAIPWERGGQPGGKDSPSPANLGTTAPNKAASPA